MKKKLIIRFITDLFGGFSQEDKRKHLYVGFAISFVVGVFNPMYSGYFGCVAASLKEWYDSKGYGQVEAMDVIFTQIGAALGMAVSYYIKLLF